MSEGNLQITFGSTNRSYVLRGDIPVYLKPNRGELRAQTGVPVREEQIDAPVYIDSIRGLGVARTTPHVKNPDNRAFSAENVMTVFPGLVCMSPEKQASSIPGETVSVEFTGIRTIMGETFVFGTAAATATDADEAILYLNSSANWVDTTARDDVNDHTDGTYIVSSMVEHKGRAYAALAGTMQTEDVATGACRIIRTDVGGPTVWYNISTGATTNGISAAVHGLESDGTLMYAMGFASNAITVYESANDGVAWNNFTANPSVLSSLAPRRAIMYPDGSSSGVLDYWFTAVEGLYQVDISAEAWTLRQAYSHPESAYSGQMVRTGSGIFHSDGGDLRRGQWSSEGWQDVVVFSTDSLPSLKRGSITALTHIPGVGISEGDSQEGWVVFAVGGEDASHNAGIYIYVISTGEVHNLYYNATANRVIFSVGFTTETAGTPRILFFEDNGVSNDSAGYHMDEVTRDPRTVGSFKHAAAGKLVLPKNDRFLQEQVGVWHRVQALGSNFSANNSLTVSKSADTVPIDTDGTWAQLEDTGGSADVIDGTTTAVYHPATPDATGESARAVQYLLVFAGASDQSAYMESFSIFVSKEPDDKYVYEFEIDLEATAKTSNAGRTQVLTDLKAVLDSTTFLSCSWGGHSSVIMKPWKQGNQAIRYIYNTERSGSVGSRPQQISGVVIQLAEV